MGCSGDCCVAFTVGATMDWLRSTKVTDGDLLGFMLRSLTTQEAADRRARFGVEQPITEDMQYYRCIYWDEETRRCGAYSNRPSFMCGDYPYPPQPNTTNKHGQARKGAGVCEHGCDCKGAPLLCESED